MQPNCSVDAERSSEFPARPSEDPDLQALIDLGERWA